MKKLILFITFSMFVFIGCYAQNNWKPGTIFNTSGDTIRGFIDYRDSRSNSMQCFFRKEILSQTEVFQPNDISGYRFDEGEYFISKEVTIDSSTTTVFLEFILDGIVNLYHYKEDNDIFFIERDDNLYKLQNSTEIVKVYNRDYLYEKKEYIGLLTLLMQDGQMQTDINNSQLNAKSLIKISKKYHNQVCPDDECIIYERKNEVNVSFGVHFGTSVNSFNFAERFDTNYGLSNFVGCRVKFENLFDWAEKVSFTTEFSLQRFSKYKLTPKLGRSDITYNNENYVLHTDHQYLNALSELDVDLKIIALKVPVTVNYTFSQGKLKPYLSLGVLNTFILSENKNFIYHVFYNEFGSSVPKYMIGYTGRIGSDISINEKHTIYTEISFDYSSNNQTSELLFYNKMYSLTVGYTF
jgi:hypothetical protein